MNQRIIVINTSNFCHQFVIKNKSDDKKVMNKKTE